ncbi:MAG: GGDEF domain-containing protein [Anaerolineales bacterium]
MIQRFLADLNPKLEFEQRTHRTRLAARVLVAHFVILAIWLLGSLFLNTIEPSPGLPPIGFNIAAILGGGLIGLLALLLHRQDRIVAAGYLLATGPLLLGSINLLVADNGIQLSSAAMIVSTLLAGAIIGGSAAYLFAMLTTLITLSAWLAAHLNEISALSGATAQDRLVFLLTVPTAAWATAVIIHSLSQQVRRSIDRLHSQAERLANLANTDPLTQLANRRYLLKQLEREFVRARRYRRPLSLMYIDLDGFKAINDRFGHLFGDKVLVGAAKSMKAVLRSTDLLARIGGDEFAVLMPETSLAGAEQVTQKLSRALYALGQRLGEDVPDLTFCAGISQLQEDDDNIEDILRRADDAQYLAKATGKDQARTQMDLNPSSPTH